MTLSDIAAAAGVSRAAVSLALRGSPSIPTQTRERIRGQAERLGYVYNRGAASLRTASTGAVAIIVHDVTNPFFAEIVAAIQKELDQHGIVAFLGDTADSPERQAAFVAKVREHNVDGVIVSPASGTHPRWLAQLSEWRLPCVLFSRDLPGAEVDYVGGHNADGMGKAVEHLLALGHRRIAMVGANDAASTGRERLAGYLSALKAAAIESDHAWIVRCPATRAAGFAAAGALMKARGHPTAAVCFNDVIAFGLILGMNAAGLRVPGDFSVIGYDDVAEAALWRPALSTVRLSCSELGESAARLLLRRIKQPDAEAERLILMPELIVRETAAAIPSHR